MRSGTESTAAALPRVRSRPAAAALVIVLMAAMSLIPALWNGFPLIFSDTNGYIGSWYGSFPIQPPYYSLAVWITSRPVSLYFTLLVQALVLAWVIYLFLREIGGVRSPLAIAGYGALVLGATQLPWVASYIMPDVFGGIGFACLMLLFLGPRTLKGPEWWLVFALAVASALFSTANFLVLSVLCIGLAGIGAASARGRGSRRAVLLPALAYLGVILVLAVLPNKLAFDRWTVHSGSGAMLFNLLVDNGIAQDYLRQHCPGAAPKACAILPELERLEGREAFLWDGLAFRTQAWPDREGEFSGLARRIILDRPGEVASLVARQTLEQVLTVSMGGGTNAAFRPYDDGTKVDEAMLSNFPGNYARFASARQQAGTIRDYYPARYYVATTYAGYLIVLGLLAAALRAPDWTAVTLLSAGLLFVVLGLAVQGGLVSPQPRYHAKVSWVAWLVAAATFHRLCLAPRRGGAPGTA